MGILRSQALMQQHDSSASALREKGDDTHGKRTNHWYIQRTQRKNAALEVINAIQGYGIVTKDMINAWKRTFAESCTKKKAGRKVNSEFEDLVYSYTSRLTEKDIK